MGPQVENLTPSEDCHDLIPSMMCSVSWNCQRWGLRYVLQLDLGCCSCFYSLYLPVRPEMSQGCPEMTWKK